VSGSVSATRDENIVSQSIRFLLERSGAAKIVTDMEAQVRSTWYEVARREAPRKRIAGRSAARSSIPGSVIARRGLRPTDVNPDGRRRTPQWTNRAFRVVA
jgi:hypothetical protein